MQLLRALVGACCILAASCSNEKSVKSTTTNTTTQPALTSIDSNSKDSTTAHESCEELAEQMMMSTSIFKKAEADTPHWLTPELQDGAYTFGLYHDFEDHTNTFAWIVVDMKKGQVYEQDIANDTLIPIDFNRSLVARIGRNCSLK